jgi:hypothetical protein
MRVRETSTSFVLRLSLRIEDDGAGGVALDDGPRLHVPARLDAELRDRGALVDLDHLGVDAERGERLHDQLGAPLVVGRVGRSPPAAG